MSNPKWLIWSTEHNAWWAPNENGYRIHRKDAGRYDYGVAREIVKEANVGQDTPNESMVLDEN